MDEIKINEASSVTVGRAFMPSSTPISNYKLSAGTTSNVTLTHPFARDVQLGCRIPLGALFRRAVRVEYQIKQTMKIPGNYILNPMDLPSDTLLGEFMNLWPSPIFKAMSSGTVAINGIQYASGDKRWLLKQMFMSKKERKSAYGKWTGDPIWQPSGLTPAMCGIDTVPYPKDVVPPPEEEYDYEAGPIKRSKMTPELREALTSDVYEGSGYRRSAIGLKLNDVNTLKDFTMYQDETADPNTLLVVTQTTMYQDTVDLAPLVSQWEADRESGMLGVDTVNISMVFDEDAIKAGCMACPLTPFMPTRTQSKQNGMMGAWPETHYEISDLTFYFDYTRMTPLFESITRGGSFFPYRELETFRGPPGYENKLDCRFQVQMVPNKILIYLHDDWAQRTGNMQGAACTGAVSGISRIYISVGDTANRQCADLNWQQLVTISEKHAYEGSFNQRNRLQGVWAQLGKGRHIKESELTNIPVGAKGLNMLCPVFVIDPCEDVDIGLTALDSLRQLNFYIEVETITFGRQRGFGQTPPLETTYPLTLEVGLLNNPHMTSVEEGFNKVPCNYTSNTVTAVYKSVAKGQIPLL